MTDTPAPIALITGATDGIGYATAAALLHQGWQVGIVGRNPDRVARAARELGAIAGESTVTPIVADLSRLSQTRCACQEFMDGHDRLDLLLLNANAIAQTRTLTDEGFEANLAIGFLSRVVMTQTLQPLLSTTPAAQVMTVVGMNLSRLDFDDLTMSKEFSGQLALGKWQWAMQEWCREYNHRQPVPMNVFMPGLVKTKILDNEPGVIQRLVIKAVTPFVAVSPEKSAEQVLAALDDARTTGARDVYYSRGKSKGHRDLGGSPGDEGRVWDLASTLTGTEQAPTLNTPEA